MTQALFLALACADLAPESGESPCTSCTLSDDNQFQYDATLDVAVHELASRTDARVDWSGITRDVHGHALAPEEVDTAYLVAFRNLSPAEVVEGIEADTLKQSDVTAYLSCTPVDNACDLSEFGNMGNMLEVQGYFSPGVSTWLVVLGSRREAGALALAFLEPSDASTRDTASMTDSSSTLEVDVDFATLTPRRVAAGDGALLLDWSAVTVDGLGGEFYAPEVTDLFLGRYEQSRDELEASVFDLEVEATESWTMALGGSTWANLASLRGDTAFAGLDTGSTWLVALHCAECMHTAPKLVAFLEPEAL